MNFIFDQRKTVFQSFKPITLDPSQTHNNRDRNDSIDTFIDENVDEELNYELSLLENDSPICINPYFISENDELHDFVNGMIQLIFKTFLKVAYIIILTAIENDLNDQDNQNLMNEDEGESFEECMIITTDIISIINDLNRSTDCIEYSISPRLNYNGTTDDNKKKKKKKSSEPKKPKKS